MMVCHSLADGLDVALAEGRLACALSEKIQGPKTKPFELLPVPLMYVSEWMQPRLVWRSFAQAERTENRIPERLAELWGFKQRTNSRSTALLK